MDAVFARLGFGPTEILLPTPQVDLTRWAVIACDQFTAQPDYWQAVERTVGDAPSTLRMILPEAHLQDADVEVQIQAVDHTMERYLEEGIFQVLDDALIYVERTQADGRVRRGLIGAVDLEQYDFTPGANARIRSSERTIPDRLPPRVHVRRNAAVELPHLELLLDDPEKTVLEPLASQRGQMRLLYAFPLQQGGGYLRGWQLSQGQMTSVANALEALNCPQQKRKRYGVETEMLFAVGDGNHSLAAAKLCYEEQKRQTPQKQWASLRSRYALVEVLNLYDQALSFDAIHRVLFGVDPQEVLEAFYHFYPNFPQEHKRIHEIFYMAAGKQGILRVTNPQDQLEAGTLQRFLEVYLRDHPGRVDYVHGDAIARALGAQPGNLAFCLPVMHKEQLFPTVLMDGVMPQKSFSMGNAVDKRYYMEARKIK